MRLEDEVQTATLIAATTLSLGGCCTPQDRALWSAVIGGLGGAGIGAKGAKTPHYFSAPNGEPLAFAVLWETWRDAVSAAQVVAVSDAQVDSATIIVGAANNWMARYHDRMPVILDWRDAVPWMAGDDPAALLRAPCDDALQEWIVSPRVNRSGVGDVDPTLVEPQRVDAPASA